MNTGRRRIPKRKNPTRPQACGQFTLRPANVLLPFGLLLLIEPFANAQTNTFAPQFSDAAALAALGRDITPQTQSEMPAEQKPGTPFAEILRGNGTRMGYVLSHGGVQTNTLRVSVSGRPLRPTFDYWIDAANGTLFFTQNVSRFDSINANYRYVEGGNGQRNIAALPGINLTMGRTSLGFMFGSTPGVFQGFTASTYGLGLSSTFGKGNASSFKSLLYFSNLQKIENEVLPTIGGAENKAADVEEGAGHLIVQGVNVNSGGFRLNAGYQDVGKKFSGFQALKQNNAGNADMLKEITALEGEKGVKRLGFGLGFDLNAKKPGAGGLSLDWNQIKDEKGSIARQSLGFTSNNFRVNYDQRTVGKEFAAFAGLREADKTQWAQEKGLTSTQLGFGFNFGAAKKGTAPGALDFSSQKFGDESGSLQRSVWSLKSNNFGVMMFNRRSDAGFNRLANLSVADKTGLALDLYRQYDANAKAEQVTANDIAQVLNEAGFERNAFRADTALGKTASFSYSQSAVTDAAKADAKTGLERSSLGLKTSNFEIALTTRKTDAGFGKLGSLSDIEKNYLALDIRRQFDPNATLARVAQPERDQAIQEAGLERSLLAARLNLSKTSGLAFNAATIRTQSIGTENVIENPANAIQRSTLDYTSKNLNVSVFKQSIGSGFGRLATLSDVEKLQFGNEIGLQRDHASVDYLFGKGARFGFKRLSIRGTQDSVNAARQKAAADGSDALGSMLQAGSGMQRESFTFDAKNLRFAANFGVTDKEFNRAGDLSLTAPEKQAIALERGFTRSDYALKYTAGNQLKLDLFQYSAANRPDNLERNAVKNAFSLTPNKNFALNYTNSGDVATNDGKKNGATQSLLTLDQQLGKTLALNVQQADTITYNNGDTVDGYKSDYVRLQTPQDKSNRLLLDMRKTAFRNGKHENSQNLNVRLQPVKSLGIGYSRNDTERGEDPSEQTESIDISLQATSKFAIIGGVSETATTDDKNIKIISVGVSGEPVKNVTLTAKFDEVHHISLNVKDTADIAISNKTPFSAGPLEGLTITARYASLNDKRKLQNETMTGRFAWKLWKSEFLVDYGGFTKADGSTISRLYEFKTDPNSKGWFKGSFLYKVRSLIDGEERLIRRFTADARLSKNTHFVYTYGTLQEDDKTNILPINSIDVSLKHKFRVGHDFDFFYRVSENKTTQIMTRSFGLGYQGQIDKINKFGIAFSADGNNWADKFERTNHFRLSYERTVNADNYFTLSADIRSHALPGIQDEVQAMFDYRIKF